MLAAIFVASGYSHVVNVWVKGEFVKGRFDPKNVVPNISPYSVNASAQTIQKLSCPGNLDAFLDREENVDTSTY